jgi:hypothetical protein
MSDIKVISASWKMASVINHDYIEKNGSSKENYCYHLKYIKFFSILISTSNVILVHA